jgi:MFS family permease
LPEDVSTNRLWDAPSTLADSGPGARGWALTGILILSAVVSYTNRQVITLIVEPLKHDMKLDDRQISLLIGASFAIVYAVCSLAFGWLADFRSRTRIIGSAIIMWSVASALSGFAQSFAQLFTCRMVIGATEAALIPAALSLIADRFPVHRRGLATGLFLVGIFGGAGGSIIIVGSLLELLTRGVLHPMSAGTAAWRQLFVLASLPGLLLGPVVLLIRDGRPAPSGRDAGTERRHTPLSNLPWKAIGAVAGGLTLMSLSDNAILAWLPSVLIRQFSVSPSFVGKYLGFSLMLGGGAGVMLGGLFADRTARQYPGRTVVSAVACLLTIPFLLSLTTQSSDLIIAAFGIYLAVSASATASGLSALLGIVPGERRGFVMSIITLTSVAIGFGVAPTATVFAAERLGSLARGLLAVSLSAVFLAVLMFWRPDRISRSKRAAPP